MSTTYSTACVTCQQVDHHSRTYNPEIIWIACVGVRAGLPMHFTAGELDLWWLEEHLGHDVRVIDEYGSLGAPVPDIRAYLPLPWPRANPVNVSPRQRYWTNREDTPEWTQEREQES